MNSAWVFLALLSTVMSAAVNILDSHLMGRRMPGWRAYVLICDVFTLPVGIVMLFIFRLPGGIGVAPYFGILGSVIASSIAVIIVLEAMKSQDVAKVSPLTGTAPVFVAILAMIFLGESIDWRQWAGIMAVVVGGILISFKWDEGGSSHFHLRPFLMLVAASLFIAVSNVANKYALGYMSYWNSATISFILSAVLFIPLCLRRDVVRGLMALKDRNTTIGLALGNQAASLVVAVLAYAAIKLAPVALAATIFNTKPLFIFIFATLAGCLAPGFLIRERGGRKVAVIRALATVTVVGGLIIMLG